MKVPSEFHYKTPIAIRFADIDAFGHVNNAVYLTYFEIARSSYWNEVVHWDWEQMGIIIGRAEINYIKPITLNDKVHAYVRTARIGKSSFDLDYLLVKVCNGEEIICTTGSTACVSFDYRLNISASIPEAHRQKMQEFESLMV